MSKGAVQAAVLEKSSVILLRDGPLVVQCQPTGQDVPTGAVVAWQSGLAHHFCLGLRPVPQEGSAGWHCIPEKVIV